MSDVQTLAMLCSVFRDQAPSLDGYALFGHYSSRLHSRYLCCTTRTKQAEVSRLLLICHFLYLPRLLDPANTLQFDDFKKCYGEILYRWGLRDKRANVLKFTSSPPEPHKGIEFGVYCCHCRSQARGTQCAVCKRLTFQCAICHVAVRGLSNFCLSCGHGGHTSHMMDWAVCSKAAGPASGHFSAWDTPMHPHLQDLNSCSLHTLPLLHLRDLLHVLHIPDSNSLVLPVDE
ncbi:hypothetical protein XENOCAPTIV_006260 [Xenoophorus captivus]|uniref:WD repeat protein mio zinc-ribbon like domain-containing protein n=1 Tax=Xenoophorus captivus TaxID=1517983 RepID=A0ABV0S9W2_9TELE